MPDSTRAALMAGVRMPYGEVDVRRVDLSARVELDAWANDARTKRKKQWFDARLVATLTGFPARLQPELKVIGSLEAGYDVAIAAPTSQPVKCVVHERSLVPHHGPS